MKKYLYLAFTFLAFIFFVSIPYWFKINKVVCQTQYGSCAQEIKAGKYKDVKKYLDNLKIDTPSITNYSTQIKLPNTLEVNLIVQKPVYSVNQKNTRNYIFTDRQGNILTIGESSDLPNIIISNKLQNVGEKISSKYLFALQILSGLNLMYQIRSGEINNDSLTVELEGSINVIFPLEGNSDTLLGSIGLIYEKIKNGYEGKYYKQIDLRYKNPVLK